MNRPQEWTEGMSSKGSVYVKEGINKAQKERLLAKSLFLRLSIGTPIEAQ